MARKNKSGKYIISAGELASFTVCPEAWRLNVMEKVDSLYVDNIKKGQELHAEWAADVNEARFLTQSTRTILLLISLAVLVFLLTHNF